MNVLCGLFELHGSVKYLNHEKTSFKSAEGTLLCKITSQYEELSPFDANLKSNISLDALSHPTATHVVVGIYWGANFAITLTDQNSKNKKKKDVEVSLEQRLKKWKSCISISPTGSVQYNKEESISCNKFSLEIFGDVLPDDSDTFPQTVDDALSVMSKMGQLIRKCNDGKGKPLTYIMFPLASPAFLNHMGVKDIKAPIFGNLDTGEIARVVQLFDHITEQRQKVHDQVVELTNHSRCIRSSSELREPRLLENSLEVQQAEIKSDLVLLRKELYSGNSDRQRLTDFCDQHHLSLIHI